MRLERFIPITRYKPYTYRTGTRRVYTEYLRIIIYGANDIELLRATVRTFHDDNNNNISQHAACRTRSREKSQTYYISCRF